jgi:hypothetical protein
MGVTDEPIQFRGKAERAAEQRRRTPDAATGQDSFSARSNNEHYRILQDKISALQNSLDYLRLGVKYMIFDLEATRRENADLRKQVQQLRGPSDMSSGETGNTE